MELAVACKRLELLLHCGKNAADLLGGALAVLRGKDPESDRRNFEINTPLEQFVQLIGTCHVHVVWMQPIQAAKPTIAIQNQSYMPGHTKRSDLPHQAMLIDPINWSEHPATAPACKLYHNTLRSSLQSEQCWQGRNHEHRTEDRIAPSAATTSGRRKEGHSIFQKAT